MPDFQFITVRGPRKSTDQATRKAVRQHVAKQHGKKKRLEDVKKYRGLAPVGSQHSWRAGKIGVISPDSVQSSVSTSIVSSPKSLLGASRSDPFEVFPIRMQKEDLELVDFWVTDLSRQRWGPDLGESYMPMRDLFLAQAVEHETSLHGMLFLSASMMPIWRPPKAISSKVSALHHRGKLLEQINDALVRGHLTMPGLLQGIGFQIVFEAGLSRIYGSPVLTDHQGVVGNYQSCRRHLIGMRSIVLLMGGPANLNDKPRVQIIFIYLSFDTAPDYLPLPVASPNYTPEEEDTTPNMVYQTPKELAEVNSYIQDTIDFLRQIQTLSERGWGHRLSTEVGDFNPFGSTTLFYQILSPKWLPTFDFSSSLPQNQSQRGVLGQHRTTRMACLLLLCQAILAFEAPSQACDDYMLQQVNIILIERADEKPDLRPFLHLLMKDNRAVRLRDLDVAYTASKNAQVIKRLSIPMHDKVGRLLLGCLAGERADSETFSSEDFERIRDEALHFQPP